MPFSSKGDKVKTVEQYSSCAKAINHQKSSKEGCSFLFKKQIDGEYQKDFQREKRLTGFSQLSKCLKNALGNVQYSQSEIRYQISKWNSNSFRSTERMKRSRILLPSPISRKREKNEWKLKMMTPNNYILQRMHLRYPQF